MSGRVMEFAPFRLKPDVSEGALLAAASRMQERFLKQQPGYLDREVMRGCDGGYVDVIWWRSHADAAAAMPKVHASRDCLDYFEHMQIDIANAGTSVLHFEQLR
ncbi:MAG: hypothetical protein KGI75_06395 [Rhizobiaceae bacterium]|nr:hypothetical protein [Rhizobiaceae bacterium]